MTERDLHLSIIVKLCIQSRKDILFYIRRIWEKDQKKLRRNMFYVWRFSLEKK